MVLYTSVKCVAMLCAITATSAYSVTSSKRVVALSSGELDATKCVAVLGQTAADDGWCLQNCGNTPPNCPPELCSCDGTGVAPSPSPEPVSELAALVPPVPVVYATPEEADAARAKEREPAQTSSDHPCKPRKAALVLDRYGATTAVGQAVSLRRAVVARSFFGGLRGKEIRCDTPRDRAKSPLTERWPWGPARRGAPTILPAVQPAVLLSSFGAGGPRAFVTLSRKLHICMPRKPGVAGACRYYL